MYDKIFHTVVTTSIDGYSTTSQFHGFYVTDCTLIGCINTPYAIFLPLSPGKNGFKNTFYRLEKPVFKIEKSF